MAAQDGAKKAPAKSTNLVVSGGARSFQRDDWKSSLESPGACIGSPKLRGADRPGHHRPQRRELVSITPDRSFGSENWKNQRLSQGRFSGKINLQIILVHPSDLSGGVLSRCGRISAPFAARCFYDLKPQSELAMNWHVEIIAAKLTSVRHGKIPRLVINLPPAI